MSLVFVILLSLLIIICLLLAKFFRSLTDKKARQISTAKPSQKNIHLKELSKYSETTYLFFGLIATLSGIWLAIYIGHSAKSFWRAFLTILVVLIVVNFVQQFYSKIQPLALFLTPYIYKIVKIIDGPVSFYKSLEARIFRNADQEFDKADLIEFLSKVKPGDDLKKLDIDMALRGLNFGGLKVSNFYTPRKVVKFIDAETEISTVVTDDLYRSGFSRFPVYSETPENIVGTLYLKDLVEKLYSGKVSKIMSSEVYDIAETASLDQALRKFITTKHHMFIVENEFKEIIGVLTLEDVLEQLIGQEIIDESDVHDDMRKVAKEETTA